VFRICTRPPSCRILSQKVDNYLKSLNLAPSGIDIPKEKFPNRDWLVLAVATLSAGQDEIFSKEYIPAPDELRRAVPQGLLVHNNDGLLDVPEALRDKSKKRALKMATLCKEDRLKAQLMLMQDRSQRQAQREAELKKEIEKEALKAKGMSEKDIEMDEMKQEVLRIYKQQADEYVKQEIQKFQKAKLEELEAEFNQRLAAQALPGSGVQFNETMTEQTEEA